MLLPDWLVIGPDALSLTRQRQTLHEALAEELHTPRPGRIAEIERLLEAMVIRALRAEVVAGFWSVSGWLGALTDPVIRTGLSEAPDLSSIGSVKALAGQMRCSTRRLSARMRRTSGTRPGKLLRKLHFADLLEALEHPAPCLEDIARGAGYSNVSSFCRAFRREIGCSPAEYWRRRHRRPFPRAAR